MCGLVGLAARYVGDKQQKLFNQMLIASTMRGRDSVGVAVITRRWSNAKYETGGYIARCVGTPFDLGETKMYEQVMKETGIRALIGHTRSATKGVVNKLNAHPFDTGEIIGAHNGTISSRQPDEDQYGTDSECMYNNIARQGLKEYLGTIRGAWALTYFNFEDQTLNFLRNSQRSLAFAYSKKDDALYWASEAAMLYWLLTRNDIHFDEVISLPVDTHIAFKLFEDDWTNTGVANEVKEAEQTVTATPFRTPAQVTQSVTANGAQSETATQASGTTEQNLTSGSAVESPNTSENCTTSMLVPSGSDANGHPRYHYKGFKGHKLTPQEHWENLDAGCAWCNTPAKIRTPVRYITKSEYFCEECMKADDVEERIELCVGQIEDQRVNHQPNFMN